MQPKMQPKTQPFMHHISDPAVTVDTFLTALMAPAIEAAWRYVVSGRRMVFAGARAGRAKI